MTEEPTCGQGLAQHAALPRLVGALLDSVADNLTAHIPGLVSGDDNTQREKRVYEQLSVRHREVGVMLKALADEMAGCENMPTGAHDVAALASQEATDALTGMIRAETHLLALVEQQLSEHKGILGQMGS